MAFTGGRGREFWEKAVREFEQSPSTQEAFAQSLGVSSAALRQWRLKLRREPSRSLREAAAVRLLPVQTTSPSAPERMEVGVDGVVVRFQAGTDTRYIAQLVEALREHR
jgi:transposase-like protein